MSRTTWVLLDSLVTVTVPVESTETLTTAVVLLEPESVQEDSRGVGEAVPVRV